MRKEKKVSLLSQITKIKATLNMKIICKSTMLFGLLINACFSSLAQNLDEKQLFAIADTFITKYQSSKLYLSVDKSINFTFDKYNNYYTLTIPALNDLQTIAIAVKVTDKIGSTSSYCSKILAHELNQYIIEQLVHIEDTLLKQGNESTEALSLIKQTITSELKFCTRFTDSYYLFNKLKRRHYSMDALTAMKALLNHPYKTSEEAKIVLASLKPKYTILDTIGFVEKTYEYKNILLEHDTNIEELNTYKDKAKAANVGIDEWLNINVKSGFKEKFNTNLKRKSLIETYTSNINSWIYNAEKSKTTLKHWLDSMQALQDTVCVRNFIKEPLVLWPLVTAIGQSYLNELGLDIEHLIATGKLSEDEINLAELQLARIQYKEYETEIIHRIENEIKQTNGQDFGALNKLFEKLVYINTQESFYATAPLLLNQNYFNNLFTTVPINAHFFVQLKQFIHNFPWDEEGKIKELEKKDIYIYSFDDPWDVNYYLPNDFLKQMYQWMLANRGKYEIDQEH